MFQSVIISGESNSFMFPIPAISATNQYTASNYPTQEHINGYRIMSIIFDVCPKYLKEVLIQEMESIGKGRYVELIKEKNRKYESSKHHEFFQQRLDEIHTYKSLVFIDNYCFSVFLNVLEFIIEKKPTESINQLRKVRNTVCGHPSEIGKSNSGEIIDNKKFTDLKQIIIKNLLQLISEKRHDKANFEIEDICTRTIVNEDDYRLKLNELKRQIKFDFENEILKEINSININLKALLNQRLNNPTIENRETQNIATIKLKDIKEKLLSVESSTNYCVLILIGLERSNEIDYLIEMLKSIATFGCWNLILDFHHEALDLKIYDSVKPTNRNYETLLLSDLARYKLNAGNKKHGFKDICYFIKCNGCSDTKNDKEKEIEIYTRYLENLLIEKVKSSSCALKFITLTIIGNEGLHQIEDQYFKVDLLHSSFKKVFKDPFAKIKIDFSNPMENFVLSFMDESNTRDCFNSRYFSEFKILPNISERLIIDNLSRKDFQSKSFYYLIVNNEEKSLIQKETLLKYRSHLKIYHHDFGNREIDIDDEEDSLKIEDLKIKFLKGGNISARVLWLNEQNESNQTTLFIERSIENQIIKAFFNESEKKPGDVWNNPNSIFKIKHTRSAGGTTLSRSILFKLRKYFVCLEATELDQKMITDYLKGLNYNYKNHFVLLIEQDILNGLSEHDLNEFQRNLTNNHKNCKIIYVCRVHNILQTEFNIKSNEVKLSTKLDKIEKQLLSSIYPKDEKSNNKYQFESNKIHFYSLYYFNEDFTRIDEIIDSSFETIKCDEKHVFYNQRDCTKCKVKLILFLMSSIEKLTMCNLNKESAAFFISRDDGLSIIDNTFKYNNREDLSALTEVAILNNENATIKFAHSCLANKVLKKLECFLNNQHMQILGDLILKLVQTQSTNKEFKQMLVDLLINNKHNVSESYKTKECKNIPCKNEYCQDYHRESERRRIFDKRKENYKPYKCGSVYKNSQWNNPNECKDKDVCKLCHTENEYDYHPYVRLFENSFYFKLNFVVVTVKEYDFFDKKNHLYDTN